MAVGVRSSSSMRSSLRSISSRRWRIRERLLSEVINHRNARKRPQPPLLARALVSRAYRSRSLLCGKCALFFASPTSPSEDRYRLVALPPALDLLLRAKHLFVAAKAVVFRCRGEGIPAKDCRQGVWLAKRAA